MSVLRYRTEGQLGGTIIAVLLLLVLGIIIAASVLVTAEAARATAFAEARRTQARAIGWSGVQALMGELAAQREELLQGQKPSITAEWELFALQDGTRGVVRLIDLEPAGSEIIVSENAKLDINTVTAAMLARVPGLDPLLADKIVKVRENTPFTSVAQLLQIEEISPELLYGVPSDSASPQAFEADSTGSEEDASVNRGLHSFLTVFSFDPNIQAGLDGDTANRGNFRINLNQAWSDDLERAIAERFDQETADFGRRIMESGQTFLSESELVDFLVTNSIPPEQWALILDVFTTTDDQFLRGRVDVNVASPEVLSCLPGLSREHAESIVAAREGLDIRVRRSPTWLVTEGVLTPEEYVAVADWVTTRSMQWRAKLEVGFEVHDLPGDLDEPAPTPLDTAALVWENPEVAGDRLASRVVLEAVIDLGSTRPRVAYLRETTLLEPVFSIHLALAAAAEEEQLRDPFEMLPTLDPIEESAASTAAMQNDFSPEFQGREADVDDLLARDLDIPANEADVFLRFSDTTIDSETLGAEIQQDGEEADDSPAMIDRRIGRWSPRKAGK